MTCSLHDNNVELSIRTAINSKCEANISKSRREAHEALQNTVKADDMAPWARAKLMVVGQGRAGKTSTIKRLTNAGFESDEASTLGITKERFSVDIIRTWNGFRRVSPKEPAVVRHIRTILEFKKKTLAKLSARTAKTVKRSVEGASTKRARASSRARKGKQRNKIGEDMVFDEDEVAKEFTEKLTSRMFDNDSEDSEIELTIWDYGGQKVFYALHHLFLTEYGVYMLVFDMKEALHAENVAVEYLRFWMKSITLHTENSPVVLVGTFRDVVNSKANWKKIDEILRRKVNIVSEHRSRIIANNAEGLAFYPVDNLNATGLTKLRDAIISSLSAQRFMREEVPLSWIKCLNELQKPSAQSPDYYKLEKVEDLAKEHGVSKPDVPGMLASFHGRGVLFHFNRSTALSELVILKPQWLVDALTCVIFDAKLHSDSVYDLPGALGKEQEHFVVTGIISEKLLANRWSKKGFKAPQQEFLRELMYDMLLLCRWPYATNGCEAYLVPSVLLSIGNLASNEEKRVDSEVMSYTGPRCEIDFSSSYLPMGFFQRLVCLCAKYCQKDPESRQPEVRGNCATLGFGLEVDFGLVCKPDEQCIVVVIDSQNSDGAQPHLVKLLLSMLRDLKEEFMGKRLTWELKLSSSKDVEKFAVYSEVAAMHKSETPRYRCKSGGKMIETADFKAWFTEEEYYGDLEVDETAVATSGKTLHRTEAKDLLPWSKHHVFISYYKKTGSEIASILHADLTWRYGYEVWFDEFEDNVNPTSMLEGVRESAVYLLVLSEGVFERKFVLKEAQEAMDRKKPCILVHEYEKHRPGYCDFDQYLATVPPGLASMLHKNESLKFLRKYYERYSVVRQVVKKLDRYLRVLSDSSLTSTSMPNIEKEELREEQPFHSGGHGKTKARITKGMPQTCFMWFAR